MESVPIVEHQQCYVVYSEQNEMMKQVHPFDVFHWQLKRCVNGSLCEACTEADSMSETSKVESLVSDDRQPLHNDDLRPLTYIAGVDISYVKNDNVNACAACIVVKLPDFDVCSFAWSHYLTSRNVLWIRNCEQ